LEATVVKYGKYEIKNVKVNDDMSRETICFSLDLYVEGKKFALVSNEGRGGCHRTVSHPPFTDNDIARVEQEMAQDEFLMDDAKHELFDTAVTTLILLKDAAKDVQKFTKSKAAYIDGDKVYSSGYKSGKAPDEALFASIRAQYPGASILNTMSIEGAAVEYAKAQRRQYEAEMAADPLPGVPRI
jgi:hypothetical protein